MKFIKTILSITVIFSLMTNAVSLDTSAINLKIAEVPAKYVSSTETEYFDSLENLADYVREKMTNRVESFEFAVPTDWNGFDTVRQVIIDSTAETDKANQGDYLRKSINGISYSIGSYSSSTIITFDVVYHTNAEQEELVEQKISEVLEELNIQNMDEYGKISAIYEYIINHVTYKLDAEGYLKYTAYGALCNEEAVCQGISQLFYRMAKEAGISCRMIIGDAGGGHAWNIASINGVYYLLDPTFDLHFPKTEYCNYFLCGTEDFDSYNSYITHVMASSEQSSSNLDYDYTSETFKENYPISATKYIPQQKLGDLNNDGLIDSVDASVILNAYSVISTDNLIPLTEPQKTAADINSDGVIDSVDASIVLQYYSYISTNNDSISMSDWLNSESNN